jgi:hypothetical protein
MSVRWYSTVVDCSDVAAQAGWWAAALGWTIAFEAPAEVAVVAPHALAKQSLTPLLERGPGLVFVPVPEGKAVKNRLHIDLAPGPEDDQAAEVERLVQLGASNVDVGQSDSATWVVLADLEGNEFCVLSARD